MHEGVRSSWLMQLPTRLHITWADDKTMQVEAESKSQGGDPQWQADSAASWVKQYQSTGFPRHFGGPAPSKRGAPNVVATHMRSGYLRENGVPYTGKAMLS